MDIERFLNGQWDGGYTYFGAHVAEEGVCFRLWAPHARQVALCGEFNGWQGQPMQKSGGVWQLTVPEAQVYDAYKYAVTGCDGVVRWKADPYAFHAETRPGTASKVYDLSGYEWDDAAWQAQSHGADEPMNIYEVHLGSWRRKANGEFYSYRESADALAWYVGDMGYHYVELLPVTEYPLDDSWGYQCTGYFAPTSRYGTPHDFMYLVDRLHQAGIGVILDWVGAHFCKDAHGLMELDGTCLYEYADPLKREHSGWGTRVFDYGRGEVRSFLLSSAAYWIRMYHIDALRVDAVASMLYLDYDRQAWRPNRRGGRENEEAIAFLRRLNTTVHRLGARTAAEESTAFPGVTAPVSRGGLGFDWKWNMGWMNDVCHYLKMNPFFRRDHHRDITFSMVYAFSERFVLPISHDEVVHGKGSLRGKMFGEREQQLAGLRSFWLYMLCHPGKILTFMGTELGQWHEWDFAGQLDWYLLDEPACAATHACIRHMNRFYRAHPPLWENDRDWGGFSWIVPDDNHNNMLVFLRRDRQGRELLCAVNFAPVMHEDYRFGVPMASAYREVCSTDEVRWGGSGVVNPGEIPVEPVPSHGYRQSIAVRIPPLGGVIWQQAEEPAVQDSQPIGKDR